MPGPLPDPGARRRNAPTIPTTNLPRSGRTSPPPDSPYPLGERGSAWWAHAWSTPQSCGWDEVGDLYVVARRAQLEDDAKTVADIDVDFADLVTLVAERDLDDDTDKALRIVAITIREAMSVLKGLAGGKVTIAREMRELDDRLGLTPKGMAQLRWKIVADEGTEKNEGAPAPTTGSRARLVAVDAAAS